MWQYRRVFVAFTICISTITIVVVVFQKPATKWYHRHYLMKSISPKVELAGELAYVNAGEFIHHRDRLVDLGELFHQQYKLNNIENTQANRKLVLKEIEQKFQNHYLWELDTNLFTLEPMILDVWESGESKFQNWTNLIVEIEEKVAQLDGTVGGEQENGLGRSDAQK